MTRIHLFVLAAAALITPVLSQVVPVQPVQRPADVRPPIVQPQQRDADVRLDTMTMEEAKATIARLNREKRELDARLSKSLADLQQMTSRGGSLVRAYCESPILSRNTAGASENCAASGYTCGAVDGLCRKQCTSTSHCAAKFTCDIQAAQCVHTG
jgi:hypothetical protein